MLAHNSSVHEGILPATLLYLAWEMASSEKTSTTTPRIILHGGAGNITRSNLPNESRKVYKQTMLDVLTHAYDMLRLPGANALDIATFAVSLLENNALFNAGRGAVYTTAGTHELEASVMVSRGYRKRGVGVMGVTKAKNPIKLAREMLVRGEWEDGGGAQGHCQLQGTTCDRLVEEWGLEMVKPSYFWTRRRWDEHRRGLGKNYDDKTYQKHRRRADEKPTCNLSNADDLEVANADSLEASLDILAETSWDGKEYLPQGTVGCVVLDSTGTLCTATSTGGLTNKLPGRIGDTPTLGAGFWAEEWTDTHCVPTPQPQLQPPLSSLTAMVSDCIPGLSGYIPMPSSTVANTTKKQTTRAAAMSGTGNGDSFLRLSAVRTAAAIARYSPPASSSYPRPSSFAHSRHSNTSHSRTPLQDAVTAMAGPDGMLQQSAEDRWGESFEGEGGIIGIEVVDGKGEIVWDFNCGGMFHAWVDDGGRNRFGVFQDQR